MTPDQQKLDLKLALMQAKANLISIELRVSAYRMENVIREWKGESPAFGAERFIDLEHEARSVANHMDLLRGQIL